MFYQTSWNFNDPQWIKQHFNGMTSNCYTIICQITCLLFYNFKLYLKLLKVYYQDCQIIIVELFLLLHENTNETNTAIEITFLEKKMYRNKTNF